MNPLAPKLKEVLLRFKTPREALEFEVLCPVSDTAGACQARFGGYVLGVSSKHEEACVQTCLYVLTPKGKKAWEELQDE